MSDAALRMDRMYRWQTGLYDFTRRPYLLGRDHLIEALAPPAGGRVLEIGCGTARNLIQSARRWPDAQYYGIDIAETMLLKARKEIARKGFSGKIAVGYSDAVTLDPSKVFGQSSFHRIIFSFTLSMIPEWEAALERAASQLQDGASILIADFGDQRELPAAFRAILNFWLSKFDVTPRREMEHVLAVVAARHGLAADFVPLYRGYSFIAALRKTATRSK